MLKVLIVGDPHIKVNNVKETEEMTQKLIQICQERKPNFVILLGDILDRHSNIHVVPLMRAEKLVLELSKLLPVFLVIGNHDRPNNSNFLTDEHPFNAMKLWPNTYIIDKVETHTLEGIKCVFVPYVPPGRLQEAINTIPDALVDCKVVICHQEIRNCKMGAIISTEGDEWSLDKPLIISGHIHDYDRLQPNVIYVGTPVQHTYSENVNKAVSMFTFTLLENNNNSDKEFQWEEERIDLGLMKKVTVYVTPKEVNNYVPPNDKQIKLVIRGTEAEIKSIAKLEKLQELKRKGVKVVLKTDEMPPENVKTNFLPKMTYKDRLRLELGNDAEAIGWFNQIFN
jgi:DNA repair exonuclease SbcCD nuclease subunit